MKKIALIAFLATTAPIAAHAGHSAGCNVSGSGSTVSGWTCSYTYTW